MAQTHSERGEVNARIVYWGIDGAGKSTNLRSIHAKLRPDHRGQLREVPTRLDPTVSYEVLPIELGELGGLRTRIEIVAVPGAPEHAPTRKQLLDRVDGVVFVIDASPERLDENIASFEELRAALAAYGRSLEEIPLVIQHNKEDLADPYALEELHRKLNVRGAAVFVAVARDGTGVLQTLTTISKRVIRTLRHAPPPPVPPAASPARATTPPVASTPAPAEPAAPEPAMPEPPAPSLEDAALALADHEEEEAPDAVTGRTEALFQESWSEVTAEPPSSGAWTIRSVGRAMLAGPRRVRLPLILCDEEGREVRMRLCLSLEGLDPEEDD